MLWLLATNGIAWGMVSWRILRGRYSIPSCYLSRVGMTMRSHGLDGSTASANCCRRTAQKSVAANSIESLRRLGQRRLRWTLGTIGAKGEGVGVGLHLMRPQLGAVRAALPPWRRWTQSQVQR